MATIENDSAFVAPEGVYSVTEEFKTTQAQNHAANAGPILYPTRMSSIVVHFPAIKQASSPAFAQLLGVNKDVKKDKSPKERDDGVSFSSSDTPSEEVVGVTQEVSSSSPTTPHEQRVFFPPPQPPSPTSPVPGRKKVAVRPKHNLRTSSSTFITRVQVAEGLTRTLQSKQGDVTFLFYNLAKSYLWIEAGSRSKDPLARITFSAYPTCHDVNLVTAAHGRLDVIIGFNSGDILWLDPINSRYARLNKQRTITVSACTAVRWVPSSPTLFLVSHADGTIIVYDSERNEGSTPKEWDPLDDILVTVPPWSPVTGLNGYLAAASGKFEREKGAKNPVSHWRISRRSVVDFIFSPDVKYIAAISEDGCLRVIDALAERLVDCYASYFGAFTCVAWSPDGRFILTGGQDDLLTIFSPGEQRVIARCQGHSSFVAAIAFDDFHCDERTYRFGSVGEDNKLILWDFSSGALHRPKIQATHQRASISSPTALAFRRDRSPHNFPFSGHSTVDVIMCARYHPAPSRNDVAVVQPVLIKSVEGDLLTDISILPRCLVTAAKSGHVKLWVRPLASKLRGTKCLRGQPATDKLDFMS